MFLKSEKLPYVLDADLDPNRDLLNQHSLFSQVERELHLLFDEVPDVVTVKWLEERETDLYRPFDTGLMSYRMYILSLYSQKMGKRGRVKPVRPAGFIG